MIKLISHCHSYHSFDSSLPINQLIEEAKKNNINAVIINDHDVISLSNEEINLFNENGILILKAIEFTTNEGVHIIGVHEEIKSIQDAPFRYKVSELIDILNSIGAKIILPHPGHSTGICGNHKISDSCIDKAISNSHASELDNYRYGITPDSVIEHIKKINPNIIFFIASDAHKQKEFGSFLNIYNYDFIMDNDYISEVIFNNQPEHLWLKRRSHLYFKFKIFQKSFFYQSLLRLISPHNRRRLKSFLKME